jgi:uncharacterized protein YcbK (DUF882 family)
MFIKKLLNLIKKENKSSVKIIEENKKEQITEESKKEEIMTEVKKEQVVDLVTKKEILMGRDKDYPLTKELEENLDKLHKALNKFRVAYGKPLIVTSGYRPGHHNDNAGGAKKSAHMECLAVDFRDTDGAVDKFCVENQKLLEDLGLWLEHPDHTPGWCHLDLKVRSKRGGDLFRTFKP